MSFYYWMREEILTRCNSLHIETASAREPRIKIRSIGLRLFAFFLLWIIVWNCPLQAQTQTPIENNASTQPQIQTSTNRPSEPLPRSLPESPRLLQREEERTLPPATAPPTTTSAKPSEPKSTNAPIMTEVAPGLFELKGVRFSKAEQWVEFPAQVELREGDLEYLLVGPGGKRHESVLYTDVDATLLHAVVLLMGVKLPKPLASSLAPAPQRIDRAYLKNAPQLTGVNVRIELEYKQGAGPLQRVPATAWVLRSDRGATMAPRSWLYTGSFSVHGAFMARAEQSFVALVTDPAALINNPGEGRDDDRIWRANSGLIPAKGTPVTVHLFFDLPHAE